jgi:hypothetical protein
MVCVCVVERNRARNDAVCCLRFCELLPEKLKLSRRVNCIPSETALQGGSFVLPFEI